MKRTVAIIYSIFLTLLFGGCEKSPLCDCLKSNGKEITETRNTEPFHYIEMRNKINLYLHNAAEYKIEVIAGKNMIEKVTTEVENGILKIDNENKCNWVRDFDNRFDVHLYVPYIDTIEVFESSGNIYFVDTLEVERFSFQSWSSTGDYFLKINTGTSYYALQTGPASLTLSGKGSVTYMWNQGQGVYDASAFTTDDIYCTNRSMNHMYVTPNIRLYSKIEFSGNIYYSGNPTDVQLERYGSGEYIHLP